MRRTVMCASAMENALKMAGSSTRSGAAPAAKEAIDRLKRYQLSYEEICQWKSRYDIARTDRNTLCSQHAKHKVHDRIKDE